MAHRRYTCPMHPEVVQDESGERLRCGMAPESRRVGVEQAKSPKLKDTYMTRPILGGRSAS